jgi:quinol monooxygenase YgiN
MIVRFFSAQVRAGQLDLWQQKVEKFSIPWLKSQRGLCAYYPGKPLTGDSREYSMTSIWEDMESLQAAVGEDWNQVVLLEDEASLVENASVAHYEYFDIRQ